MIEQGEAKLDDNGSVSIIRNVEESLDHFNIWNFFILLLN